MMTLMLIATVAVWAAPECMVPTGEYIPTQLPYTQILDRGDYSKDGYIEALAEGPPWMLENGAIEAGHPYFGPMCDLAAIKAGEPEPTVEEFVQQYRERGEWTRDYVARAKSAGVTLVTAYICMITVGGDPVARSGFWNFYDNWDAFAEFDIPPQPADDPETWQQHNPDGSPVIAYSRAHKAYKPMFRWTNCINNPSWRAYQQWVTEEVARLGIDGFFVDNAGTEHCYCPHCQAKFADWLRSRYTGAEIDELFGGDLSLAPDWRKGTDLRTAETNLFWQESIHEFLADVKRWGSAIHGSFFVYPNGLHRRAHYIATRFRDCDLAMDENSTGEYGTHPGMIQSHVIAGIYNTHVNDNILSYKFATGAGTRCRVNLLCRSGYPRSEPGELGANANTGSLGIAESAAFGGGGCYLNRGPLQSPWLNPVRATWNAFLADNRDLYEGKYPYGQVGIFTPVWPQYFNDRATVSGAGYVLQALGESHILCDLMTERILTPEWLARYPAVVVPFVRIMSESQRRALIDYAQAGGKLIVLGNDVAALDRFGRERAPALVQELLDAATARDPASIAGALEQGGALADMPLCQPDVAELVRMSAYVNDPNAPTEMTLHLVNYAVRLGLKHDEVESVEELELSVPLPPDTTATSAVLKCPGSADVDLTVTEDAKIIVPRLDIYGLVHIALKRGDA
jgi:hypothetical protein